MNLSITKKIALSLLALPMLSVAALANTAPTMDIVDTAVAAGQFTTLVSLVQKAGLVDTLKGNGPFTVFAPTDAAFAKLPKALVNQLLNNPDQLKAVLTYHVLSSEVLADQAISIAENSCTNDEVPTVNGQVLRLSLEKSDLYVNQSKVIEANVLATNGVIHVIDTVLIPKL